MHRLKALRSLPGRAAGSAHSSVLLTLATGIVFGLALILGWTAPLNGGCVVGGASYCVYQSGNPCTNISCTPTGQGYNCTIGGKQFTENFYLLTATPGNWPRCTSPAAPSKSCTETYQSCGATSHYLNKNGPTCQNPCNGTWYWSGCKGAGNGC
jgi:hypothetical protein